MKVTANSANLRYFELIFFQTDYIYGRKILETGSIDYIWHLRSCQPKGSGGHEYERIARSHSNALCVVAAVGDNVYTTEAPHLVVYSKAGNGDTHVDFKVVGRQPASTTTNHKIS